MAEERQTKLCKTCYEQIDQGAQKCPYCKSWQSAWPAVKVAAGAFGGVAVFSILLVLGLNVLFGGPFSDMKRSPQYGGELHVLASEMRLRESDDRTLVSVVGQIENSSDVPWEDVQIEIQFMDSEGKLVDTVTQVERSLTVPAHQSAAFRIDWPIDLPAERYADHSVFVRWAEAPRRW